MSGEAVVSAEEAALLDRELSAGQCDPTKPSRLSPVPHEYKVVDQEYDSLANGGSYDVGL